MTVTLTRSPSRATTWQPISSPIGDHLFLAVKTPWLTAEDDLRAALAAALPPLHPSDTVVISEKVAVLLTGRAVPISAARPGRLATYLAGRVRPRQGSRGLSVPEKMQYVLDTVGIPRLLAAAIASALTRPLGRHGVFYRVAGPVARDLDGGRPPYLDLLFPPLEPRQAAEICRGLQAALGAGVAIVDLNDFGGTIRATSPAALTTDQLSVVLADNPLGQRSTGTPFGVVRTARSGTARSCPPPSHPAPSGSAPDAPEVGG